MADKYWNKNPYRHFDKYLVESCMRKLKINPKLLSGESRQKRPIAPYYTFHALSDGTDYFAEAMTIELEHGRAAAAIGANVTNDDPMTSAMIAWAHIAGVEYGAKPPFKPFIQYYDALIWMEVTNERTLMTS